MDRVVVIGGGPAGFMAAIAAASRAAVSVYDAGVPLATLLRTGGGRCNLTNSRVDPRQLADQYPRGGTFLISVFTRFGTAETMEWFRSRGLPLVEEDGGRIFPRSGRADDVRDVLVAEARRVGVAVHARQEVLSVARDGSGFVVTTPRGEVPADGLVIATGGAGGGADGFPLARSLGHTITPIAPSLTGLVANDPWPRRLAGLTIAEARLVGIYANRRVASEAGSILFTHDGVSGPLAFRVSARAAFLPISPSTPLHLQLSVCPRMTGREYEKALLDACVERPRQQVATILRGMLPRSIADVVLELAGVDPSIPACQLTREKRRTIARLSDRLPLAVVERRRGEEIVTAGGVALDEVDQKSMESRIVPRLHFCGECLDSDGFTGGFNLQAAWSTGMLAGLAVGAVRTA
ncbi:MAG TPA: aminoacetone oxidase family FAD-binding enzyme [Spirochaetia bacterium]